MDPLLAAERLPRLADRATRSAILDALERGRRETRALVERALIGFERNVQLHAPDGVRPALLFALRDRIVRVGRLFLSSRLAQRLLHLRKRDVIARGTAARPFDLVVRARDGSLYAIVFRTIPEGARSFEFFQRLRDAALRSRHAPDVVTAYDLETGALHAIRVRERLAA